MGSRAALAVLCAAVCGALQYPVQLPVRTAPPTAPAAVAAAWRRCAGACATFAAAGLISVAPVRATNLATEAADLLDKYYYDAEKVSAPEWQAARVRLGAAASLPGADGAQLRGEALKALKADRYTRLLDASTYKAISRFDVLGIGLILSPGEDGVARVISPPLPGSAAYKSGAVKQGDSVVQINGKQTEGLSAFELLDLVEEAPDKTRVALVLRHPGAAASADARLELKRDVSTADASDPIDRTTCKDGVAYIHMNEFSAKVAPRLAEALAAGDAQGCSKRVVIDVRGNPGGAFQSAISAASLFLPKGAPVVTVVEKGKGGEAPQSETFGAKSDAASRTDRKVELWIDHGSASSSEIFAGAMRDNCAAIVAGNERSYGKGLIQAVFGLADDTGLVVTVAQYKTPNGDSIQGIGIQPEASLPKSKLPFYTPVPSAADFDETYDAAFAKRCALKNAPV